MKSIEAEGVLKIDAASLRDHSDADRTDRVWERLEPKLTLDRKRHEKRLVGRWPLAVAAVAAGFAMGIGWSGWLNAPQQDVSAVVLGPAGSPERTVEVFAAGTTPRSYPLPGGGTITVEAGSIVDTVSRVDGTLTLRLVRGNAMFVTPHVGELSLIVGDAQIGSVRGSRLAVRRDGDHALVEVFEGSASLSAPNANNEVVTSRIGANELRRLRIHTKTASIIPQARQSPSLNPTDDVADVDDVEVDVTPELPTPPWIVACKQDNDDALTVELLKQSPGAAANITDPEVLACIARGHRMSGNENAAIASYERLLGLPNKIRAVQAATKLQRIFEKRRDAAATDAERQAFAAKAQAYAKQKRQLELDAVAQGGNLEAFELAATLCNRIEAEAGVSNWKTVTSLSAQYKGAYPHGPCTTKIDEILAKRPADDGGGADPEEDSPYDEGGE